MNKRLLTVAAFALAGCVTIVAQDKKKEFKMPTGYAGITHEMSEFYEPVPPVVTSGTDLKGGGFTAPSDAIVLFDGKDLSAWESVKGGAAEWDVHDGVFTVNKKKGDIQTKQKFNDFQMHIEWQVPTNITGESQSRGNSGIFLQGMYEVQVLDCYNNPTYVNGQTGSIYKQSIPLANAMRKPGEWNVYSEIKRKLIEDYGIPSSEIRFIQECKNERARKAVIAAMNEGSVRVLFGSTSMLGTGVNAQKRCVAIHHCDTPWVRHEVA